MYCGRVLLVGSDEQVRDVLKTVLTRVGYTVTDQMNFYPCPIGLNQSGEFNIDLIVIHFLVANQPATRNLIMDFHHDYPAVKLVVVLSGQVNEAICEALKGLGADAVFYNPFVFDDFLNKVSELLAEDHVAIG